MQIANVTALNSRKLIAERVTSQNEKREREQKKMESKILCVGYGIDVLDNTVKYGILVSHQTSKWNIVAFGTI